MKLMKLNRGITTLAYGITGEHTVETLDKGELVMPVGEVKPGAWLQAMSIAGLVWVPADWLSPDTEVQP